MLTYKIHLLRHGITQANLENRYIGKTDVPLCTQGRGQILQLLKTRKYPVVDRVYTSPLKRAMQTAELLFPQKMILPEERLSELDFGDFENRSIFDLEKDPAFQAWISDPGRAAPGGESGAEAMQRASAGLSRIFTDMMEQRIYSVALVTHGGILSGLLAAHGLPQREVLRWTCPPGEGFTILFTPQMWMRDEKFEVYSPIPWHLQADSQETTAYWEDLGDPFESENDFDPE